MGTSLTTHFFRRWSPVLDDALASLPADSYPHDLHRLLCEPRGSTPKEIALVTEHDTPVGVVGLRRLPRRRWCPVSMYVVPGAPFPAQPGRWLDVVEALHRDVRLAWWRMPAAPPHARTVREVTATRVHRMPCSADFEAYWREHKQLRRVRSSRKRCAGLRHEIDALGTSQWVITSWARAWSNDDDTGLADHLAASDFLEARGLQHSFLISDGDQPVAGTTMLVHDTSLVAGLFHRDRGYDELGVGHRLIDMNFEYARESGFAEIDIGGGKDYKRRWAPEAGWRWDLTVCPAPRHAAVTVARQARDATRAVARQVPRLVAGPRR